MLQRLLFPVRSFMTELGPRLGSWRLSVVVMVVIGLYYLFLGIWARSSPPDVVQNIAGLLPFWLAYALLLINNGVCLWRRIPTLQKEISATPILTDRPSRWRVATPEILDDEAARARLLELGYRVVPDTNGTVVGIKRRWTALGTYLFHGAFFLVALGFLFTLVSRQEARVWVSAGEDFENREDQYLSQTAPKLLGTGVPPQRFQVASIRPEFWRDQLLFTTLEADLVFPDGRQKTTRINRPLWLAWGTFLRMSGFGFTPRYELADRNGFVLDSNFMKLNLFPPGQRDYFNLPNYPHRLYLEVMPDAVVEEGQVVNRSLNLVNPAVSVEAYRGRLLVGSGVLELEEALEIEGLSLSFPEIRYWGEFAIVRDVGAPIVFLGYLVGLIGLTFKLKGRRAEARWSPGGEEETPRLEGWGGGKTPS